MMAVTNYSNRIQQIVTSYKVDFKFTLTSHKTSLVRLDLNPLIYCNLIIFLVDVKSPTHSLTPRTDISSVRIEGSPIVDATMAQKTSLR